MSCPECIDAWVCAAVIIVHVAAFAVAPFLVLFVYAVVADAVEWCYRRLRRRP